MKILSCDCPLSRAKCKQVKVKFRQFSTNLFSFFALSDFTILKCGPNLLKHQPSLSLPPWSSRRRLSLPPLSSSRSLSLPRSSSRSLSLPPLSSSRSLSLPPLSSSRSLSLPPLSSSRSLSLPLSSSRSLSLPPLSSSRSLSLPPRSSRRRLSLPPQSSWRCLSPLCFEFTQKMKTVTGNQTVGGPHWLPLYWGGGGSMEVYTGTVIDQNYQLPTILSSSSLFEIFTFVDVLTVFRMLILSAVVVFISTCIYYNSFFPQATQLMNS